MSQGNWTRQWSEVVVALITTGWVYLPPTLEPVPNANSGVGVYATQRGMEINLSVFQAYGEESKATGLLRAFGEATGTGSGAGTGYTWPSVKCERVNRNWDRVRTEVIIPYFTARMAHANVVSRALLPARSVDGDQRH